VLGAPGRLLGKERVWRAIKRSPLRKRKKTHEPMRLERDLGAMAGKAKLNNKN
jgi:hypothetical protein